MGKYPLIGKLALKNRFLIKGDLDKALAVCSGDPERLEDELIRHLISTKLVSSKDIEKLILDIKNSDDRLKFGEIAIKKGFISKTNLQFMLEEQESDIVNNINLKFIGDMLIEASMITCKQRDLILEVQKKLEKENKKSNKNKDNSNDEKTLLMKPVLVAHGLRLQITADFLAAFFIKTDKFDSRCTVNDIKDILIDNGIISGVVADELIVGFLKSHGFKIKPFRIAKGVQPVQGEDAKIRYFFNIEHLKAGGVNSDGQIDFKDRGRIPQVEEGSILAEKIPMVEAKNGKNVYGEVLSVEQANDINIKTGEGAKLSTDGLQVVAAFKGHPIITSDKKICVNKEYVIKGDVDYETGHIDYDGNINIKGCVKSGFKVKGHDIKALEIDDGIIEAKGDVKVSSGIKSERIYVEGDISAKFIHKSYIVCKGDISVDREVIDAVIKNRGKCSVVNGKIISSEITSKLGVFAKGIGTQKGKPSIIKVGQDVFSEKELQKNKISIDEFNKTLEKMVAEKEKKVQDNENSLKGIEKYIQIKNISEKSKKTILSKLNLMATDKEKIEYPEAVKVKLKELQIEIQQAEKKRELYLRINSQLEKQIKELGQKIGKQKLRIKNLEHERENLIKWIENNPGKPVVFVSGVIMAKTIIQGIHSRKILEEEVHDAKIREIRNTKPDAGPDAYIINITH